MAIITSKTPRPPAPPSPRVWATVLQSMSMKETVSLATMCVAWVGNPSFALYIGFSKLAQQERAPNKTKSQQTRAKAEREGAEREKEQRRKKEREKRQRLVKRQWFCNQHMKQGSWKGDEELERKSISFFCCKVILDLKAKPQDRGKHPQRAARNHRAEQYGTEARVWERELNAFLHTSRNS